MLAKSTLKRSAIPSNIVFSSSWRTGLDMCIWKDQHDEVLRCINLVDSLRNCSSSWGIQAYAIPICRKCIREDYPSLALAVAVSRSTPYGRIFANFYEINMSRRCVLVSMLYSYKFIDSSQCWLSNRRSKTWPYLVPLCHKALKDILNDSLEALWWHQSELPELHDHSLCFQRNWCRWA